ncbi:diacylglycerol/lipid kinase family protein [Streptococcus marimammalium]|uniref:diacylglycerol/lipid kinase family protein n=1 Tax=Streptococcus marimammalium TaxID=269666 RepID=UPI0003808199|nr:diacylglycerol kinase family protein [Streptococcus marimammalium]
MKIYLLANPNSGDKSALEKYEKLIQIYPEIDFKLYITTKVDDEKNQISAILSSYNKNEDAILVIGGDGTLSKVLSHLPKDIPFAYYPSGSGNDFARSLKINHIDNIILAIKRKQKQVINVINYNNGIIINSLDFGFAAKVISFSETSPLKTILGKVKLGKLVYPLYGIVSLFCTPTATVFLETEQEKLTLSNIFFLSFANSRYFGGGIVVWPNASPFGTNIDCVYFEDEGLMKNVKTLLAILFKKHQNTTAINHKVFKKVTITSIKENIVQVDGEVIETNQLSLCCEQREIYL